MRFERAERPVERNKVGHIPQARNPIVVADAYDLIAVGLDFRRDVVREVPDVEAIRSVQRRRQQADLEFGTPAMLEGIHDANASPAHADTPSASALLPATCNIARSTVVAITP